MFSIFNDAPLAVVSLDQKKAFDNVDQLSNKHNEGHGLWGVVSPRVLRA